MTGFLILFLIKWTILLFHQKILFFEYLFVLWMGLVLFAPSILYVVCHEFGDSCKDLASKVVLRCSFEF